jgi:hypothetical protein
VGTTVVTAPARPRPPAARRQAPVGEQQDQEDDADDDAGHVGPAGQPAGQLPAGQRQLPRGEAEGQGRVLRGEVEDGQDEAVHQQQPGQQVAAVADHDQGADHRQDQRVQDADGVVGGDQLEQVPRR